MSCAGSCAANVRNSASIGAEPRLVPVDEVHLVHGEHDVRDPEQRGDERVAPALLDEAVPRIDEDDREVRGRGPGHHVARVLDVAGRVRDDELAARGREVAIRDVDRDPLLALGAQAIGQQREVDALVAAPPRHVLDVLELVLERGLGVVEQPADQGRLAIIDGAGGGEPQQLAVVREADRAAGAGGGGGGGAWPFAGLVGVVIRSSPRACGLPSRPR